MSVIPLPPTADDTIMIGLRDLRGPAGTQCSVLSEIIEEADLFKKKTLVKRLREHMSALQSERISTQTTPEKRR